MLTLQIKVKPNSNASALEQGDDGIWLARLKSPPIDGKANDELVALVARRFGCPKSAVSIKSGASGRLKLVRVDMPAGRCVSRSSRAARRNLATASR